MRPKDKQRQRRLLRSLALLVLAAGATRVTGQSIYLAQAEDQSLRMPHLLYLDTDVEIERDHYTLKNGGGTTDYGRNYVAPTAGIGWDYFLYHPDLMTFSTLMEPGYNWEQDNNGSQTTSQHAWLLDGAFHGTLLQRKPYATMVNYNRSHDQYSYDFFNSVTVDSEIWGVNTGYREGAVPTTVDYSHAHRDSNGLSYDSTSDSDTVTVTSQNTRHGADLTTLNYQFSEFNSTSTSAVQGTTNGAQSFADSSTLQTLQLTDTEVYRQSTLNSSLYYEHVDGEGSKSDDVNGGVDYSYQHTPNFRSFYDYNFTYYSSGGSESLYQFARAGVEHELYESLVSTADLHGGDNHATSPGSTLDQYAMGTTGSVSYSKRLGGWGHLSLSDTASYDVTQQDSSGSQQLVANESHVVPLTGIFFLSQGRDLSWVSLTDASGALTYVQGSDYDVITTSNPWQIRTYTTGPNHIVAGQVVKANYFVQPNPSGNYSVFNNNTQIRLDFWDNHAGLFLRYSFNNNQASSSSFVLETVDELQAGGDMNWRRLRLSATYTDRTSSFYTYQSFSTSEGYTLLATAKNSASLNFNQQWSTYPGTATNSTQNVSYYSWTGRYEWHPVSSFSWSTEAGYEQQHGGGTDQDFIVARTSIGWNVGKLDVRAGYEFQNQNYTGETRQRNFAFLRVRRNF
jgi:hypothetical protein